MSNINENNIFKLGIDIHGVISAIPDFFSFLSESIIKNNGEVHIITGGSWTPELDNLLKSFNIKYTHSFSVYDHLVKLKSNVVGEIQFPDGTTQKKFENEKWDKVKAEYCKLNNISLHIDDTLIYNDFFSTPFCRLWSHNQQPKSPHKDIRHFE
jgi:hypothetical protein